MSIVKLSEVLFQLDDKLYNLVQNDSDEAACPICCVQDEETCYRMEGYCDPYGYFVEQKEE